ncbi:MULTISPECIES: transposase [Persicobacter]|uniref:Transposase n=1 Tax=Persicobacter diffluens TaxID=981 RepID=A0AAN5AMB8_9BACT|nr:transposase [Persicobacter sp. CCB-QB2]GJM60750.1 hypothetical protein PEDI_13020 [Persicobacter diffluens]GJM61027.1 hypothetical protein PEDI_15790 [Persicobacter diffluens]GJM62484.1 hypothetical protein PEDI_30360 [Persicobacter diffluens]GJM63342.1 hypothetical protein PEDI_38940 [Persicobacter diffluens]GJM63816.1 hypothetical protein PEDI_43680 [Persicobacter diffluens]
MKRVTRTKEEKLAILKECEERGVEETLSKYGVYPATYKNWVKKYETMGEAGFTRGMTIPQLKEIKRLEKENALLKEIIAEKELESKMKDELLKKKYPQTKGRK